MFSKHPLSKKTKIKFEKKELKKFPVKELKAFNEPSSLYVLMGFNSIPEIPGMDLIELSSFWKFSLIELHLNNNFLKELPREISVLAVLKTLVLDNNYLQKLPRDIGKLKCLETLSICNNQITELPFEISEIKSMKKLKFSYNRVTKFPRSFGGMASLTLCTFDHNPIQYPPYNVLCLGWGSIRQYLAEPVNFLMTHFPTAITTAPGEDKNRTISHGSLQTNITQMATAIKEVLMDPLARNAFGDFLKRECSYENLLFWEAIENLRKQEPFLQPEDFQTEAVALYSKYVKDDAQLEFEVNLPFSVKEKWTNLFQGYLEKPSYRPGEVIPAGPSIPEINKLLAEAQTSIFSLLACDSFQRFKQSEEWFKLPSRENLRRAVSNKT